MRFRKKDHESGKWIIVDENVAREKVGRALRDAAQERSAVDQIRGFNGGSDTFHHDTWGPPPDPNNMYGLTVSSEPSQVLLMDIGILQLQDEINELQQRLSFSIARTQPLFHDVTGPIGNIRLMETEESTKFADFYPTTASAQYLQHLKILQQQMSLLYCQYYQQGQHMQTVEGLSSASPLPPPPESSLPLSPSNSLIFEALDSQMGNQSPRPTHTDIRPPTPPVVTPTNSPRTLPPNKTSTSFHSTPEASNKFGLSSPSHATAFDLEECGASVMSGLVLQDADADDIDMCDALLEWVSVEESSGDGAKEPATHKRDFSSLSLSFMSLSSFSESSVLDNAGGQMDEWRIRKTSTVSMTP
jgi:hypothetical protein